MCERVISTYPTSVFHPRQLSKIQRNNRVLKQAVNPAFNDDGTYTRAWTIPEETIKAFGFDIEKQFWAEILWTACELETKFRSWQNQTGIRNGVKEYWDAQFVSSR